MTDRQDESNGDTASDADGEGVGGGPKRVVSNKSVDDILASLEETSDSTAKDGVDGSTRVTRSADDGTSQPRPEATDADTPADVTDSTGTSPEDSGLDARPETEDENERMETGNSADRRIEPDGRRDCGSADTPAERLSRIESGGVTGADVRAAETGAGRERTPEVDEIDLSLEDLEATSAATTSKRPDGEAASGVDTGTPADAGPLAGTIRADPTTDRERAGDHPADADERDEVESVDDEQSSGSGLLDRLRNVFSR